MTKPIPAEIHSAVSGSPFDLNDTAAYQAWRDVKLARRARSVDDLVVPVADINNLSRDEYEAILSRCRYNNMAVYAACNQYIGKSEVLGLGHRFGLGRLDGNLCSDEDKISALQVSEAGRKREYIPYSNRRLSWHTDGYYNTSDHWIRAFVLHCVRPAAEGGESHLLDHEMLYIQLRDENPAWIAALMAPDAMTIPANIENGVTIRGAETGPVFSFHAPTRSLHMRYSARERNIVWRDDPATREAVEFMRLIWQEGSPYIYHHRLMHGQGVICNNTLHCRSGFTDEPAQGQTRLLYRARYFDRIQHTGLDSWE